MEHIHGSPTTLVRVTWWGQWDACDKHVNRKVLGSMSHTAHSSAVAFLS